MRLLRHLAFKAVRIGLALVCLAIVGSVIGVTAFVLISYKSYAKTLVPPQELVVNRPSTGAKILDRNGKVLYEYVDDTAGLRQPVALDQVSPLLLAATVATEDADFFTNPGINIKGLGRAVIENLRPARGDTLLAGSGGSSITQQLVKNLYIPQEDRQKRSLSRKIQEVVYALELTKRYDKSQILDWYVNQISYGGIYSGVEAASEGYFGKPASDLTLAEAALLAGIPQSPAAYDPVNNLDASIARRDQVLNLIEKRGRIQIGEDTFYSPTPEELAAARSAPVEIKKQSFPINAPHFVLTYVAPELEQLVGRDALLHDGLVITTSLDIDLQDQAQGILDSTIARYEDASNSHNGALIVISPPTGEILAMVGSRDYFRDDIKGQVNNLLGIRSPGSSFKPFVYLTALEKFGWTPGTIIQDSPIIYHEVDGSTFQPQNPTKNTYLGPVSVRKALGNSLNIPAFKTALQAGPLDVVKTAKSFGFTSLADYYGPSIAIGGVDLRGLDLAYGYSVLANNGTMQGQDSFAPAKPDESTIRPVAILKVVDRDGKVRYDVDQHRAKRRVAPAEQTYMITDALSDPSAVCLTFGCGGVNVPGYKVAVKTGTSEPFDPNGPNAEKYGETWAFGYTPDFAVGVWAGNSDYAPIVNIFSTTIAFPVMRDVMLRAYNGGPETPFTRPQDVVVKESCAPVANLPTDVKAPGSVAQAPFPTRPSCGTDLALDSGPGPGTSPFGGYPGEPPECAQMRGRPYTAPDQRPYFLQNCLGPAPALGSVPATTAGQPQAAGQQPSATDVVPATAGQTQAILADPARLQQTCAALLALGFKSAVDRDWYTAHCT